MRGRPSSPTSPERGRVSEGFLYSGNEWVLLLVFLAGILAVGEVGFRLGRRADASLREKAKSQVTAVEAGLLGILGLLLAFTMSMAVSRFEIRKQLVLEEANAIGTSYLRTRVLPEPQGPELAGLLRRYLEVRLQSASGSPSPQGLAAQRREAERLQAEFWSRAADYAQKDPNPVKVGLLLQSLNQAIDLEAAGWMAFHNHVPATVIWADALMSLLAALLVGYGAGLEGRRQVLPQCLLALAITLVLGVIVDLDRPYHGFIRVSQQPMFDLQQQMRPPQP